MGYKTKVDKKYKDKHGVEHADAYAAIDTIIIEKRKNTANLILKIYANKTVADSSEPFEICSQICSDYQTQDENGDPVQVTDYTNYMSANAVEAGDNHIKQAYKYWTDKQLSSGNFKFEDWEDDI